MLGANGDFRFSLGHIFRGSDHFCSDRAQLCLWEQLFSAASEREENQSGESCAKSRCESQEIFCAKEIGGAEKILIQKIQRRESMPARPRHDGLSGLSRRRCAL